MNVYLQYVWFVIICTLTFLLCGALCICDHSLSAQLLKWVFKDLILSFSQGEGQ